MALVVGLWRKFHAGYLFRNRSSGRSFLSPLLACWQSAAGVISSTMICVFTFELPSQIYISISYSGIDTSFAQSAVGPRKIYIFEKLESTYSLKDEVL